MLDGVGTAASVGTQLLERATGQGKGDVQRDGTLTDPKGRGAVPLERAFAEAKAQHKTFGEWLMQRYAFQPGAGHQTTPSNDHTLRFFSPGLNTPEPEASRRTAYYADQLGQPMLHLHNGSNADAKMGHSDLLDYGSALTVRSGMRSTALISNMVTLLKSSLAGADPQDVHAILYSDSTIAGSRAIATVRTQLIAARRRQGKDERTAISETEALLKKHLFVEMHGNVAADLPSGPRYVLWTDRKDGINHQRPFGNMEEMGFNGSHPDTNAQALYVDYDGPYGGADAHNLAANGVHAVKATWAANGVSSSQDLYDRQAQGHQTKVPSQFKGDAKELWNPHNDPEFGKKHP
jgi:hypothetical protein